MSTPVPFFGFTTVDAEVAVAAKNRSRWNELTRKLSRQLQRLRAVRRRGRRARPFIKVPSIDLHTRQSYVALTLVFTLVAFASVERLARRWRRASALGQPGAAAVTEKAPEAGLADPLGAKPWVFFHPVWETDAQKSLFPLKRERSSQAASSDFPADVAKLVDDPKDRIEREFKVTPGLRDRVLFWMQVHAVYNSRMRVVHDRANPAIVYGYIDFRPLFRALGNGQVAESRSYELEKKILKELKARLAVVAGLGVPTASLDSIGTMSLDEKNAIRGFLSRVGALSAQDAATLIENLRTQTGQSDEFLAALHRSKQLLPHIESVFRKQGLPVALGRIPFVESSFNARAQSKVGAVGIWQFMPETARQMIHSQDERAWADPLKQTASAARLLKMFHSIVPDWGMAVTAYNSGVGRIQRLARKHHLRNVEGLIKLQAEDDLGFAGRNFYAQFLSANLVEAYKEELFNRLLEPADYMLVMKDGQMPFPKESCGAF